MNVLYANNPPIDADNKQSIFLVGPTPRKSSVPSWRPEAIATLQRLGFSGTVLVPEREDWNVKFDYQDQIHWEQVCLHNATLIAAWVPRNMETMPALTTNVEFGFWIAKDPKKLFYGRPDDAPSNRYLDWMYRQNTSRTPSNTLESLLTNCVKFFNDNYI